jgi:Putative Actinobacterial Holin-X, holin superfamily III
MNGLSGAAQRVADHARQFVQLEIQLAMAELKRKAAALGVGAALLLGAAVFAFLGLCFALAAAAAGIATTSLTVWESLLIVCGGLMLLTMLLAGIGFLMLQKGTKPVPEQAVEEARLTTEALRNGD